MSVVLMEMVDKHSLSYQNGGNFLQLI